MNIVHVIWVFNMLTTAGNSFHDNSSSSTNTSTQNTNALSFPVCSTSHKITYFRKIESKSNLRAKNNLDWISLYIFLVVLLFVASFFWKNRLKEQITVNCFCVLLFYNEKCVQVVPHFSISVGVCVRNVYAFACTKNVTHLLSKTKYQHPTDFAFPTEMFSDAIWIYHIFHHRRRSLNSCTNTQATKIYAQPNNRTPTHV